MTADLSEDLKRIIDQYLDGHRSRSLATLARVSGVSYTTLRRFWQREGQPSAAPVLKIVDVTLTNAEKIEFINKHFPEIAHSIGNLSGASSDHCGPEREDLKFYYTRDPHNLILNLAVTTRGTSVETIQRLLGERGLEALDEMVDCGVLKRDFATGSVRYREGERVAADPDEILVNIKHSVDYFDRRLIGTKAARASHMTASVSEEALYRIHRILSDAISEIYAIKNDPRSEGGIPFFADVLMNVYDRANLPQTYHDATGSSDDAIDD